jgi:hypothetical protein
MVTNRIPRGGDKTISRDTKDEELEDKLRELREQKTRMSEAYVAGRIPQDVYKKAVIKVEGEIANLQKEIRRRTTVK